MTGDVVLVGLVRALLATLPAATREELLEAFAVYRRWCRDGRRPVGTGLDTLIGVVVREAGRLPANADQRRPTPTNFGGALAPAVGARDATSVPSGYSTQPDPTAEDPALLTYSQAAELQSCSVSTVRRRVKAGQLKAAGSGSGRRIVRASIEAFADGGDA